MVAKRGHKPTDFDTVVLARACEQFTGAEIEAVFIDAQHEAFAEGVEPSTRKHILPAMTNTVPLNLFCPLVPRRLRPLSNRLL